MEAVLPHQSSPTTAQSSVGSTRLRLVTKNWYAFRDAMERGDGLDNPAAPFIDLLPAQKFFGGGTLAVSFQEAPKPDPEAAQAPIPTNTALFAMCFKDNGPESPVWYDAAHVEGTPMAP